MGMDLACSEGLVSRRHLLSASSSMHRRLPSVRFGYSDTATDRWNGSGAGSCTGHRSPFAYTKACRGRPGEAVKRTHSAVDQQLKSERLLMKLSMLCS